MTEMTLEAKVENLDRVLSMVEEFLNGLHCPLRTQMRLAVVVEELYVNIASYAYTPGTGDATIRIEAERDPLTIVITLIDSGVPYDPLQKPDPDVTLAAKDRKIGGLGIFMAKKIMDEMKYQRKDGRNILTVRKRLE